jgi:AraC-like DNA-binding protein
VAWVPHRTFGRAIPPISSSLVCDPPHDLAGIAVFGDNVTFGASATELVYDRADVDTLIRYSAPPPVVEYVDYLATSELGKLPAPDDIVAAVSNVLAQNLADGPPDIAFVARVLAMSVRTLQRRLHEHQVTYGAVLDSVRRDRARDMLERGGTSMGDIARTLGYSEQAVFSRATRRWFGVAPTSVGRRRRLPGASG